MVAKFIAKTVRKSVWTDDRLATIHPLQQPYRGGDAHPTQPAPLEIKFIHFEVANV